MHFNWCFLLIFSISHHLTHSATSVGDNLGFDMATFMSEISRLKLSNQQMTISTVVLDRISIQSERGIGLGLSSCRREGVVPGPKDSKNNNKISQFYQFFDTSCVWSHLHPFDEKNVLENKFKLDKKIAKQTQHVVSYILSDSNFISVFSFF